VKTRHPRNYKPRMSRNKGDEDEVRVLRMGDGREHGVMKAGNENTRNMHARTKTEYDARKKLILARLQRNSDVLPEARRNTTESQSDDAHVGNKDRQQ
jgi:hypothetical protein